MPAYEYGMILADAEATTRQLFLTSVAPQHRPCENATTAEAMPAPATPETCERSMLLGILVRQLESLQMPNLPAERLQLPPRPRVVPPEEQPLLDGEQQLGSATARGTPLEAELRRMRTLPGPGAPHAACALVASSGHRCNASHNCDTRYAQCQNRTGSMK